jgi:tRNA/tmRNA/rRNA uracil-C5-methylase (TrmA/RlmC/RlmD family)
MAEETLSEALSKLDDDNINSAALPEGKRVEEEVQDDATYIEFSEEEMEDISPVTEDSVQEDFEAPEIQDEEELSEAEVRARTAQNRINQAVKQAKDYQRRELQALQYAKELQEQNEQLASQLQKTQTSTAEQNLKMQETYSGEFATRVETQAEAAKRNLKTAYESGDPEAMAEAQQLLAKAEADRNALAQYQRDLEQYKVDYAAWLEQQEADAEYQEEQMAQQQPAYQEPIYQEPSPKAQEWASANEWFGTDTVMTNVAFAIHNDLIQSGVDLESDEYYAQIDSRMRQELPHKFNGQTNARDNNNVQTVVSGSRTTGSGRNQNSRRVELNPSEQALARKLGVPFKEYAKQKMRLQNS